MAGYSTPYAYANYLGEWVNDAAVLVEIRAREWDHLGDGTGNPRNGMSYYDTTLHAVKYYIGGAWIMIGLAGAATLDVAYDGGGAGLGRIVTVDAGDVEWNLSGANSHVVDASACTGAVDGWKVNDGTDYFHLLHGAANTLNLDAALAVGTLFFSGTFDIDSAGALSLNASGGAINIGNDADAQAINIGTGAAARLISIGNATGASQVDVRSGTGGINLIDGVAQLTLNGAGDLSESSLVSADITPSGVLTLRGGGVSQFGDSTGYFSFNAGAVSTSGMTTVDVDCSGAMAINSSGGTIGIGNDNVAQSINLGTAGVRTISVGSASATAVNVDAIAVSFDASDDSNFSIAANDASSHALTIAVANAGAGSCNLDIDADGNLYIDAVRGISIDCSSGPIGIGEDADAQGINIGTAGARSIDIGSTSATGLYLTTGADIVMRAGSNLAMHVASTGAVGFGYNPGAVATPGALWIGDPTSTTLQYYGIAFADASTTAGYFDVRYYNGDFQCNTQSGTAKSFTLYDGTGATAGDTLIRLDSSGDIYVSNGTDALPSYSFLNGITSGMYWNNTSTRIEWSVGATKWMHLSGTSFDVDMTAGAISLDAANASNLTVSGAAADLTLGARATTVTLNEANSGVLTRVSLDGFAASSIIGGMNELHSDIRENYVLNAATLSFNDTSVTVILVQYTDTGSVTITIDSDQIAIDGRTFTIKDSGHNAAVNNITIETEGAETIDGEANWVINGDKDSITLHSDGSNLHII